MVPFADVRFFLCRSWLIGGLVWVELVSLGLLLLQLLLVTALVGGSSVLRHLVLVAWWIRWRAMGS